ncbi:lanthionine synthetase LanC family protein [Microbispora sp. NBC_01189]|uniref:lanthionine synthetase LanC family protein n=1 Tax=Microbispora sp. NBC_01189 TaxID=2903583 RepID=UPI003A90B345
MPCQGRSRRSSAQPASSRVTRRAPAAGFARPTGRQDAWCYGTPGISVALALASQALGDDAFAEVGDTALASLATRPACGRDADGPTLCHGHSGVLQCAAGRHAEVASKAAGAITTAFDASRPFAIPTPTTARSRTAQDS